MYQSKEVDGNQLQSTTKERHEVVVEDKDKQLDRLKAELEPLAKLTEETRGDKVKQLAISSCSVNSPCAGARRRSTVGRRA